MYISYNKQFMPAREDIHPVSELLHHNIEPCESISYYRYPYIVVFKNSIDPNNSIYRNRREVALLKIELEQFQEEEIKGQSRTYVSAKGQRLYIREYADLQRALTVYYDGVEKVVGPINDDHIDLLLDEDYNVEVREPYYGKYNCKVYGLENYGNARWSRPSNWRERRRELFADVKDFVLSNYPDVRFINPNYPSVDFYIDYCDMLAMMPFLKLQYPDMRFVITKCISK